MSEIGSPAFRLSGCVAAVSLLLVAGGGCRSEAPAPPPSAPIVATKAPSPPPEPEVPPPPADSKLHLGEMVVLGAMDRSLVQGILDRELDGLRSCSRGVHATGVVLLRFEIGKEGSVLSTNVTSSTLGVPSAESCLGEKIRALAFSPPQGAGQVIVTAAFAFEGSAGASSP
jgi:hypothetical protein